MITVAKYASKEEAYIAKALLEASDIQVFIDDSQFGETGLIDIRVPEANADRARSILAGREETIAGIEGNGEPADTSGARREFKDVLLFLKGGGLWVFGYILLALILRVFGVIFPINPLTLGFIFFIGGLIGLIFGNAKRRPARSR